jgi:hypothetical protein
MYNLMDSLHYLLRYSRTRYQFVTYFIIIIIIIIIIIVIIIVLRHENASHISARFLTTALGQCWIIVLFNLFNSDYCHL